MQAKTKLIKFSLFAFVQIIIPLVVILIFQQLFLLKIELIVGHLALVFLANLTISLLGLIFFSGRLDRFQKITKYLIATLYGCVNVVLYYAYLFAFSGEYFNSKIFTLEIVLGYVKYLDEFISNFDVSPFLVYSILIFIPVLIFTGILLFASTIRQGILELKRLIQKHHFNNPPRLIRVSMICFLLLTGFVSGVLWIKRSKIPAFLYRIEEPVANVYFRNDPFDGRILSDKYEDVGIRNSYPKNLDFQKKNIVIIVIDALRSDHLGLYGYERETTPFLDSVYTAGDLRKIDLSFSVAAESFAGINSILRSRIWAHLGYDNFSLQQLLKDQGYDLNFIVSGDHSNFSGLKSFYGNNSELDYYLDGSMTKKHSDPNDDRILFEGLENIPDYQDTPAYFHFHMMSVHNLGVRLNQFKRYRPASKTIFETGDYVNRYDNGILQADSYIKEIFESLADKGYLQNSIVVITGDHGEYLGENGEFGHSRDLSTQQLLTPILIYDPEDVEYKNTRYASLIDIAPTIVDRLGLPIPEPWEGVSLYSEEDNRQLTYHQQDERYAIIHKNGDLRYKLIYDRKTKKQELYELNSDLYETTNIIDSLDVDYLNNLRWYMNEFNIDPERLYEY
ncbi:sulfatase-like hydrolase/transferase [Gramella sp. GC03-9]|uniref:Sulfatase-like hydrolase/transferase n=1 Tax=Christiangramia oceanisediminis TaxID=2920386 RepID=A0A9X2RB41_9FLAO|nr:sulfatase-like hydrolase/transferase [Gramella oceanisediminis]MCP9200874.1 sulfatase-like hydrolase/transferase [Gramella oceanisediminis]